MRRFFLWMQQDEGWKTVLAVVYATICLFDFVVVPSWIGFTREELNLTLFTNPAISMQVQLELIKSLYVQHQPFTLQGGGLFHLAFGALLTVSAITKLSRKDNGTV
jgi:hypothetical protein